MNVHLVVGLGLLFVLFILILSFIGFRRRRKTRRTPVLFVAKPGRNGTNGSPGQDGADGGIVGTVPVVTLTAANNQVVIANDSKPTHKVNFEIPTSNRTLTVRDAGQDAHVLLSESKTTQLVNATMKFTQPVTAHTISVQDADSTVMDGSGGTLRLTTGKSVGQGGSAVIVSTSSKAAISGTTQQVLVDRFLVPSSKELAGVSGTPTGLFSFVLPAGKTVAMDISWTVHAMDSGSGLSTVTGSSRLAAWNSGLDIKASTSNDPSPLALFSSGTATTVASSAVISGGNTVTFNIAPTYNGGFVVDRDYVVFDISNGSDVTPITLL